MKVRATLGVLATLAMSFLYEAAVLKARERVLAYFDEMIGRFEKKGKGEAPKEVAGLKDGKERFEKHDLVPWSEGMWSYTNGYLIKLRDARAEVLASYGTAELPGDLRDLIDKRVIARWTHQPGDAKITLYSSGRVNDPAGENTWSFSDGRLTLRWKDAKAPGGYWVDTCILAHDGQSYSGANQIGRKGIRHARKGRVTSIIYPPLWRPVGSRA